MPPAPAPMISSAAMLTGRAVTFVSIAAVTLALAACAAAKPQACMPADARAGAAVTCAVPGFKDRTYDIHLPAAYGPDRKVPVVLAIHGGGGNARGAARTACPGGDLDSPDCLHAVAAREGIAVVYPNGTSSRLLHRVRTWNAGGGTGDWQCVSGRACKDGVDDIAYFTALLDDLARWAAADPARIYATGLSNGGAMSHRLACEMGDRIAAVAPLGGANQYAATAVCAPPRPVPVLQIHGTADPCWRYEGGRAACAQRDDKAKIAVAESMRIWAGINGCGAAGEPEPFAREDGIETVRIRWAGCRGGAEVVLLRMEGGGHVWPGGWAYLRERTVGPMVTGWSANRVILDFFRRHRRSP